MGIFISGNQGRNFSEDFRKCSAVLTIIQ